MSLPVTLGRHDAGELAEAERFAVTAALQNRVDELNALFEVLPVGVAIAEDPECLRVRGNRTLTQLLDIPSAANVCLLPAAGHAPSYQLFQDERLLRDDELPLRRAISQNRAYLNVEYLLVLADGRRFDVMINAVPLRDSDGAARGAVATILDITAQKEAVRERLAIEHRLRETQKLEGLGILAGGIAHDFNNILTGVLGNASLARMELLPGQDAVLAALENVERSTQRAAELCKQLLAYAGKGRFVIQVLDLSILVQDSVELLTTSIGKKASLQLHLAYGLPFIRGDITQIRQVLMNLVINAAEALGESSGVLTVQTRRTRLTEAQPEHFVCAERLPPGDYVTLEVSDTGCGMSEITRERIFDPFYTTKFTGRGLGLAAALGIMRGHRGGIRLATTLGRGTTFTLFFPACLPELPAPLESEPASATVALGWRGHGDILVVDDEETVRTVAGVVLTHLGFTVTLAADGLEAVECVRAAPDKFVAVLVDLTMPRMDGEETVRNLRALNSHLHILITSGFNEQMTLSRFEQSSIAGFLPKPFTAQMLAESLRAALGD